ncbi:MAG: YrzE family protein [Actinobacteria bacterium]|nr:YrzE family protein [Actinomycetota bacterium]
MRTRSVESGKDRKSFARSAGLGQVSFISVLAGTLVAFASFAILLAIVAGILSAVGVDTAGLTSNDYRRLGIGGAIVGALVLFLSYFFGGYIAGRLARRAGALNGGLVLLVAVLIGAAVALVVGTQADTEALASDLRIVGVPTSGEDYGSIATIAGLVSLAAMLAGSVIGGLTGERWHGKLATRAFSPDVGPEAAARQEILDAQQREQEQRLAQPAPASGWAVDAPTTTAPATATGSVVTEEQPSRRERPLRSDSPRRQQ